jgi:hypothetical protein
MHMNKFSTKKVLSLTLLDMKPGERLEVKNREFKIATVRQAVCRVNKNRPVSERLICSEVGNPDGIFVWREG